MCVCVCVSTGRDAPTGHFANEAIKAKEERLHAALSERDQLRTFLTLTDTMVVTAMYDLARLALARACHSVSPCTPDTGTQSLNADSLLHM